MITFRNVKGFFDTVHNADTVEQLKQMRQVIDEKIVIMEQKENVAKDQTNVTDSTILDFGLSKEQLYGKYVYVPSKEVGDKIKKIAEEMGTKVKIEDRQYTVGFPLEACTYVKGIKFLAVYRGDDENDDTRTER